MTEPSALLLALGAGLMASWAVAAFLWPRLILTCILFAAAPGFQLFWLGLGLPGGKLVRIGPIIAVPLVTLCVVSVVGTRRNRAAKTDATAQRGVP